MGRSAHRAIRIAIAVIAFAAVALGCVAAYIAFTYQAGQGDYDEIAEIAFSDETPDAAVSSEETWHASRLADMRVDWDALRAINPDVVGWVCIPGTPVNYPVVHSHDNNEYLYVNFNGVRANGLQATYGTPFLLEQNSVDFSDPNNVIQAHNMQNGSMFAWIANAALNDPDLLKGNRTIYLLTPDANYRLLSTSVLICPTNDAVSRVDFQTSEDLSAFAADLMGRSSIDLGSPTIDADQVKRIVSLSTCTSDGTNRRCVLVCAVTEVAYTQGGESSGTGDASGDVGAATDMDEAMRDFTQ